MVRLNLIHRSYVRAAQKRVQLVSGFWSGSDDGDRIQLSDAQRMNRSRCFPGCAEEFLHRETFIGLERALESPRRQFPGFSMNDTRKSKFQYRIYGVIVRSDIELPNQIEAGDGSPELFFTVDYAGERTVPSKARLCYDDRNSAPERKSHLFLYSCGDYWIVRISGFADFRIGPKYIRCSVSSQAPAHVPGLYFLGTAMSFWLEMNGIPALHASAISHRGSVIAFMADSHTGKSSLLAEFVRRGLPLVTDDILAVTRRGDTLFGVPSYPQMRMWASDVGRFPGEVRRAPALYAGCPKVRVQVGGTGGWGSYASVSLPIGAVYRLERADRARTEPGSGTAAGAKGPRIAIDPIPASTSIMELVRNSYALSVLDALSTHRNRLKMLGDFVRQVPVRSLRYDSGMEYLPEICESVLSDFDRIHRWSSS